MPGKVSRKAATDHFVLGKPADAAHGAKALLALAAAMLSLPAAGFAEQPTAASSPPSATPNGLPARADFDLPAQPLGSALKQFAEQAGVQILFEQKVVDGLRAPAIKAQESATTVLQTLLNRTDLEYAARDHTVAVRKRASTTGVQNTRWDSDTNAVRLAQLGPDSSQAPRRQKSSADSASGALESDAGLDEVVVTGSRIRGVGAVGSTMIEVGRSDVIDTSVTTIGDLLKQVPQAVSTGYDENNYNTTSGGASGNVTRSGGVNLRGIGPQATLVLFDGNRMATQGTAPNFIDPSIIPTIALSRMEIVADGASAIYGADAIAGVVNLIPRRGFEGLETTVRAGFADDYQRYNAGAIAGKKWTDGSGFIAYEYSGHSALAGKDRDFYRSDLRPFGGSDYRSVQCNPGNVLIDGVYYALPALAPDTRNYCDPTAAGDILPKQSHHKLAGRVEQQVGRVNLFFQGVYANREFENVSATSAGAAASATLTVPSTNAYFVQPPGTAAVTSESVLYSFPASRFHGYSKDANLYAGAAVDLAGDWRVTLTGVYGHNGSSVLTNNAFSPYLDQALASSDPATAFNPFGATPPAVMDRVLSGILGIEGRNQLAGGDLSVGGSIFDLPGGAVKLAAGADYNSYDWHRDITLGATDVPFHIYDDASRSVKSVFAEIYVPVFGAANAIEGLQRLNLSAAIRYDEYSDVGSTTNPKFGVDWTPLTGLTVHASYGTSFRAPYLGDTTVGRPSSLAVVNYVDPLSPTGTSAGIIAGAPSNPNLRPETATTWSAGFDLAPVALPQLVVGASYYNVDYKDQIIGLSNNTTILQQEQLYSQFITRNPTDAQVDAALATCQCMLVGVRPPVVAFLLDASYHNLGTTKTDGIDLHVGYSIPVEGKGTFQLDASANRVLNYDVEFVPGGAFTSELDRINYPVKLRGRASVGWTKGPIDASWVVNYTNAYLNTSPVAPQIAASYTFDLNLGYNFADGSYLLHDASVRLSADNIFDRDPPFVNNPGGYDGGQASALGRILSLTLSKTW